MGDTRCNREALQDKKIPYVAVVGDKEIEANQVAVRVRAVGAVGTMGVDEFKNAVLDEIKAKKSVPSIGVKND